jgi:hypothetical protein
VVRVRATAAPHKQQAQAQTLAGAERVHILTVFKQAGWVLAAPTEPPRD